MLFRPSLIVSSPFVLCDQHCSQCGKYKDRRKFSGHRICRDCRSGSDESFQLFNVTIDRANFGTFFNHERSRGERLTMVQRSTIVALHSLNIGNDVIAGLTHCDPRTVQRWIDYYNEHQSLEDVPRSGRPRVTSEDIDTSIVAAATETPVTTPRIIRTELGIDASARTVRRRLDETGLFGRVARMEYPFTEEHINKRIEFAEEHESWDDNKWSRVLFGDETYIYLGQHGRIWIQRPEDAAYQSQFMVQGQSNFAPKIGIWGCFTGQGVGAVRIFDDNMDTRMYTDGSIN